MIVKATTHWHKLVAATLLGCTVALPELDAGNVAVISDARESGGQLSGVSATCKRDLRKYATCQAESGLYTLCTNKKLLNTTEMQVLLRCTNNTLSWPERLKVCEVACMRSAGHVLNETLEHPCPADVQAMHGFNPELNIFTVGSVDQELNVSSAMLLPFPNVKTPMGPSSISYGNPDKCVQIPTAEYCVLTGIIPLETRLGGGSAENAHLLGDPARLGGRRGFAFSSGNCLPKSCQEEELRATLAGLQGGAAQKLNLNIQCGFVRPLALPEGASKAAGKFLGWGGVPIEHIRSVPLTTGFWLTSAMLGLFLALVAAATCLELHREARARKARSVAALGGENGHQGHLGGASNGSTNAAAQPLAPPPAGDDQRAPRSRARGVADAFLQSFSLLRNARSFMRQRPPEKNDFACLDAIRAFSMCQVVLGHSFLFPVASAGLENMEQFAPPHGLLGNVWFMVVPGCFYGVDTFFLLSGFLCAHGLQRKVFSRPEFRRPGKFSLLYVKFVLARYLRLLPIELVCMAVIYNVLPVVGSGVLWTLDRGDGQRCYDAAGRIDCEHSWWANVLFIQNMDKYLRKCMIHTWYLAVDMQLYITAPIFSLCYGLDRRLGWSVLSFALIAGVILTLVLIEHYSLVPELLLGSGGYSMKVYTKPWCRASPFLIGIALAWLWQERFEAFKGRHVTARGAITSYALALLGLALCFTATFARVFLFRGDLLECNNFDKNPAGKLFMYLWQAFSIPAWSIGVGIIMTLCFQDRFLPLLQDFLHQGFWQPIAKLCYSAYLIHTAILILSYCQRDTSLSYNPSDHFFTFVSFVVCAMTAAYVLHLLVEKPLANVQALILGGLE